MRWMRVSSASEAEIRPARRSGQTPPPPLPLATVRSEKVKKMRRPGKPAPRFPCMLGSRELMAVLAVVGPLGTLISLWVRAH
mmetsp:Transcript_42925/g.89667  ORF Transcript_42925/g.89667 Transcript_42925/m.89667 type:complete len:82 (-) Transcript_42925:34-279(-)